MDIKELRKLSAKHELSLNYTAKDLMISKCLKKIQDIPNIVFKGGTAINRVYLRNNIRFSEDIDLDYDSRKNPKQIVQKIKRFVEERLDTFEIAKPRIMKKTIRFDLTYLNPLNHKDKIRIEFRIKKITEKFSKKVVNYGFVPYESAFINVYKKEVLTKHKAECILTRKEGKDIYDFYHLLDNKVDIPNQKLLEALDMSRKEIKEIANAANHYIPRSSRPDWEEFIKKLKIKIKSNQKNNH